MELSAGNLPSGEFSARESDATRPVRIDDHCPLVSGSHVSPPSLSLRSTCPRELEGITIHSIGSFVLLGSPYARGPESESILAISWRAKTDGLPPADCSQLSYPERRDLVGLLRGRNQAMNGSAAIIVTEHQDALSSHIAGVVRAYVGLTSFFRVAPAFGDAVPGSLLGAVAASLLKGPKEPKKPILALAILPPDALSMFWAATEHGDVCRDHVHLHMVG